MTCRAVALFIPVAPQDISNTQLYDAMGAVESLGDEKLATSLPSQGTMILYDIRS
jgi:hypothetical protein